MKLFCPNELQYAVIRMDAVSMVQHFNDPIATAEARALETKKYLAYLNISLDLPFVTNFWYRYQVSLIGSSLHPEVPQQGITSDMVIPIYPNTNHPDGRSPVRTETPFPFPNCYHWVDSMVIVRIRRKDEPYDDANAVRITPKQHVMIEMEFSDDYKRIDAFERKRIHMDAEASDAPAEATQSVHDPAAPRPTSSSSRDSRLSDYSERMSHRSHSADNSPEGDTTAESSVLPAVLPGPQTDELKDEPTVEALFTIDVFNMAHDDTAEVIPLVDLWFELTEHLSADTIPSPLDFYKECEAITSIIRSARMRSPNVPTPSRDPERLSVMSDDYPPDGSEYSFDCPARAVAQDVPEPSSDLLGASVNDGKAAYRADSPKQTRSGLCGRFKKSVLAFLRRAPWSARPPFLPYFP
ncbi:hypothetical protein GY45DRAFT_1436586 [Cubamyces sp. BRFM 1775]|nr:hypothetical protein GY45DRAFT_1436586 [Cubamyces sp. BRFM 1775]